MLASPGSYPFGCKALFVLFSHAMALTRSTPQGVVKTSFSLGPVLGHAPLNDMNVVSRVVNRIVLVMKCLVCGNRNRRCSNGRCSRIEYGFCRLVARRRGQ